MSGEVVDTNVLFVASAAAGADVPVPTDDPVAMRAVWAWLSAFRADSGRALVMDAPRRTILDEYRAKLRREHYGLRVVQHKFDTGAILFVDLAYESNGEEQVAILPERYLDKYFHDLGDRKIVAAAYAAGAPIVNATDGDWEEPMTVEGLRRLGVAVMQLLTDEQRAACRSRR